MTWINQPIILEGNHVKLVPLDSSHYNSLISIASDKQIWQHYAIDGSDAFKLKASLENAIVDRDKGIQYPFVIILQKEKEIIGSTRFIDIQQDHKKLEIGWTWLKPEYWGTNINLECKLLLLSYCFEKLLAKRVQLKTDEKIIRSRKAIEKIGGQLEGILRNDMIRDNGTTRNSAYYSITDSEWSNTKEGLLKLLGS